MTPEEREVMESLLEFVTDNQWDYDDNPPSNYCPGCGTAKRHEPLRHKPDCKLNALIEKAEAMLASAQPGSFVSPDTVYLGTPPAGTLAPDVPPAGQSRGEEAMATIRERRDPDDTR